MWQPAPAPALCLQENGTPQQPADDDFHHRGNVRERIPIRMCAVRGPHSVSYLELSRAPVYFRQSTNRPGCSVGKSARPSGEIPPRSCWRVSQLTRARGTPCPTSWCAKFIARVLPPQCHGVSTPCPRKISAHSSRPPAFALPDALTALLTPSQLPPPRPLLLSASFSFL